MRYFFWSNVTAVLGFLLAFWWGGFEGLFIATLLIILEISFSFDNAVVNATVLRHMDRKWQDRFLTWGILIAVFGMYYLFPILIVSVATGQNLLDVTHLAIDNPEAYKAHLESAHVQISAFGGMFLLMVFFKFMFDESKKLHWIGVIESRLARLGALQSLEVALALAILLASQYALPEHERLPALMAGSVGVVLYVFISSLTSLMQSDEITSVAAGYSGLMGFIYLQLLDASFSLDAVVGAFAISGDIVIIVIGLTVGAMYVRSLTVHLVRKGTLEQYVFLEHGAHWGIGALAVIMLIDMVYRVPETVTGLIGVAFIGLSLLSSMRYRKRKGLR